MPLFEFLCKHCSNRFEELVMHGAAPSCPSCASEDLEKLFSAFQVGKEGGVPEPAVKVPSCRTCDDPRGPGSCMN